ncbi:hypothetical protein GOL96_28205 [Sinorhizobium medicae]|nr:hypothetical protein [Sinorhizobium medicae]MDX1237656.1 hypothetical protein [Sinorhizobium medicae]
MHRSAGSDDDRDDVSSSSFRPCAVSLDGSFGRQTDKDQKHDQAVAIYDLLDNNTFATGWPWWGPYRLCLALADTRLAITVTTGMRAPILCPHCRSPRRHGASRDWRGIGSPPSWRRRPAPMW